MTEYTILIPARALRALLNMVRKDAPKATINGVWVQRIKDQNMLVASDGAAVAMYSLPRGDLPGPVFIPYDVAKRVPAAAARRGDCFTLQIQIQSGTTTTTLEIGDVRHELWQPISVPNFEIALTGITRPCTYTDGRPRERFTDPLLIAKVAACAAELAGRKDGCPHLHFHQPLTSAEAVASGRTDTTGVFISAPALPNFLGAVMSATTPTKECQSAPDALRWQDFA